MKKLKVIMFGIFAALPLLLMCTGATCKNYEQVAYRTIGTTAVLVDGAMSGWGDYVRTGKASAKEEAAVKDAYLKYQRSMNTLRIAVRTAKGAPEGQAMMETALQALSASSAELMALIEVVSRPRPEATAPPVVPGPKPAVVLEIP